MLYAQDAPDDRGDKAASTSPQAHAKSIKDMTFDEYEATYGRS